MGSGGGGGGSGSGGWSDTNVYTTQYQGSGESVTTIVKAQDCPPAATMTVTETVSTWRKLEVEKGRC